MLVEKSRRADWAMLTGYAVLTLLLLPIQSLWLDELMEVVATARLSFHDVVFGYAAHSAGQSPLGALEQAFSIKLLGFSAFAARLPAALFSIAGCAGMLALARQAGLRRAWLALLVFASFPLIQRYGTEARPYSQALCVAIWIIVIFVEILQRSTVRLFVAYAGLLAIGLYTQPYVLFVSAGQAAFLAFWKRWGLLGRLVTVIIAASIAYLPWYLHSRGFWRQEIDADRLNFHLQPTLALLVLRELTGAGYVGTLAVVALAGYGLRSLRDKGSNRSLWVALIVVPVCLTLLADVVFDYFFAIRQVIFVLPPLAVACTSGIERLLKRKGSRPAVAAAALLLALNFGYSIRWFTKPREDWASAANTLQEAIDSGGCYLAVPSGSSAYYELFRPALKGHRCTDTDFYTRSAIALAVSPYLTEPSSRSDVEAQLRGASFELGDRSYAGKPEVRLYRRRK